MVKLREVTDLKTGEKSLEIDKRTESKLINPPNRKTLRYSRHLPVKCNDCPFRPQEEGGNGLCNKYEKDAVCVIRNDIGKLFERFAERNEDKLVNLMEAEFISNYEVLRFFEEMENMSGALDPEVTKRMNAVTNLGKAINEIKTKTQSIEVTEKKTLTEDQKSEIARTVKLTKDMFDEL